MRTLAVSKITALQKEPANIRNICILAHVDHGKTTLADALVASNGIISQRMAGKLRYLDSREDEQIRGITMKSSAISLIYTKDETDTLINLIDSPGHIDFSSEVSTAVRLCDGAIVLVDVVEGVCPQTHAVLRQAWLEDIRPVLVLNKMDRLITELRMSPVEAYLHLQQILEQVNAITAELFTSDVMEKTSDQVENKQTNEQAELDDKVFDWSSGLEETDDSHLYFSPGDSNVVFTSAIDGWGFGINEFAELYAKKLGLNSKVLLKTLWGDFYLDSKTKRIKQGAMAKGKKPLFVQFILENLWAVYEAVMDNRDKEKIEKIVKSLNLKIPPRDAKHSDPRVHLQAICSQWMPLSQAVLAMVVKKLPSPLELETGRAEKLLCSRARRFDTLPPQTQALKHDFLACSDAESAPVIVFVSKLFTIERKHLPRHKQRPLSHAEMMERRERALQRHAQKVAAPESGGNESDKETSNTEDSNTPTEVIIPPPTTTTETPEDQVFVAFARIFSGTVKKGQKLYVLGPKYDPAKALSDGGECGQYMSEFVAEDLYLFMGRELEDLQEISAGNIIGLGGLEEYILKSATISSTLACPAFTDMHFEASPIVRVAVEPIHPGDWNALSRGLKLLNQADPCVEIQIQENGQHVMIAAGEVHLQKCLDDLQNSFAKVKVNTSSPIVPFRETIIPLPKFDRLNEAILELNPSVRQRGGEETEEEEVEGEVGDDGGVFIQTANRLCGLKIRALPIPKDVIKLLEDNSDIIKELDAYFNSKIYDKSDKNSSHSMNTQTKTELIKLKELLDEAFKSASSEEYNWDSIVEQIWCFGPRRNGPNMLVNKVPGYKRPSLWSCLDDKINGNCDRQSLRQFDYCIMNGFQMATLSGPLCEESMHGVCFILDSWENYDKALSVKERKALQRDVNSLKSDSVKRVDSNGSLKGRDNGMKESSAERKKDSSDHLSEIKDWKTTNGTNSSQENKFEHQNPAEEDNTESLAKLNIQTEKSHTAAKSADIKISGSHHHNSTVNDMINTESSASKEDDVGSPDSLPDLSPSSPASPPGWQAAPRQVYGPFYGQIMSCMKKGCRRAFQAQPQRLMWAMYTCVVQATAEVLGKMYGVLSKRHGRVLGEDMKEGSSIFNIDAVLPVVESFGFAEEIRKRTSGLASPQLRFSHWEVIDLDPFWVPTTEEEYLHFGEKADSENVARKYMNSVRRRKGLHTDDKLVEFGEKQRTLTRNK